jgi:hypothetical protein
MASSDLDSEQYDEREGQVDTSRADISIHENPRPGNDHAVDVMNIATPERQHWIDQMVQNGWCTHQAHSLGRKFDLDTFQELSKLEVSEVRRRDHTSCLQNSSCVAYNVNMDNYQTVHRTKDCNCMVLQVPYDDLIAMIGAGKIPLVSIRHSKDSTQPIELRLQRRTLRSKYTAISHVWADGLGNPAVNALPTCQLQKLADRFDNLHGNPEASAPSII